jgi:hypothetical protein
MPRSISWYWTLKRRLTSKTFSRPLFQSICTFKWRGTLSLNPLECHAVSTGKYLPTFRRIVVGSSSRSSNPKSVALTSKMKTLGSFEKSTPVYHQLLQPQTLWTAEEHVDYQWILEDLRTITRHIYVYAYVYIYKCAYAHTCMGKCVTILVVVFWVFTSVLRGGRTLM